MAGVQIRAGELRHRVTVKSPSTAVGSHGQRSDAEGTIAEDVACSIRTLSGRELEQARQLYPAASLAVEMRYGEVPCLTAGHKLVLADLRELHIEHADNVEQRNILWRLLCGEIAKT